MVAICSEWEEDWWCWEAFSLVAAQSKWGLVSTKLAPSTIVFESMLHHTGFKYNCLWEHASPNWLHSQLSFPVVDCPTQLICSWIFICSMSKLKEHSREICYFPWDPFHSTYFSKLLPLEWKLLLGIGFIPYRRLSIKICEFFDERNDIEK